MTISIRSPKEIRDFAFRNEVRKLMVDEQASDSQVDCLARAIFSQYIRGKPFEEALQIYVNLASKIDDCRREIYGSDPYGVDYGADLRIAIASIFANELHLNDEQFAALQDLTKWRLFSRVGEWERGILKTIATFAETERIGRQAYERRRRCS